MARWTGLLLLLVVTAPLVPGSPSPEPLAGTPTFAWHAAAPSALLFQDAAQLAAEERERQELLQQMTYVLVQQYLGNARALEEQLDFDGALREVRKARDLDPTDKVVLDYMRQLQALLGEPEASSAQLRVSARDRYEAQRQQMKVVARNDLSLARRSMDVEDFGQAEALVRGVVNRIAWSEGELDWGSIDVEARDLLDEVERLVATYDERVQERTRRAAYEAIQAEERQQARQQEMRVNNLLVSATKAFDRADYETAETLAQAVLDIDQHHAQAQQIVDASQDAAREYADRIFIQTRREEFNRWRNEMDRVRIPTADIYTDPDAEHWAEITALRGSRRSLGLGALDPEWERLDELLESTRMDAEFDSKTIVEVANNISFAHDIPVHVDPEVVTELDDIGEFVDIIGLRDITVKSFLNVLVEQVGDELAWTIRNGRVYITKVEKAQGSPITRVHPIQDLTFKLTDFKGTNIRDIALPGEAGDDNETTIFNSELDQVTIIDPEEILNLVRENIATEDWDTSDNYNIDFVDNNNLLVIHTPEVQAQVAEFLDDLRVFSTSMVTLESRFFSLSELFIEEIGTDLRGLEANGAFADQYELDSAGKTGNPTQGLDNLGDGTGNPIAGAFYETSGDQVYSMASENFFTNPLGQLMSTVGGSAFQFEILDDTEINLVMNLVSKSQNAMEITAPTVSVYNTQRAFVTVVNQVSFVQDYEVDVATNAFIADPVIGIAQEGIVLDVRPTISYDRKYITLDVQTTVAELERPFPSITTLLGPNGSPVTFSTPALAVQDAQTTVVVPDGGAVILGGFKHVRYKNRTAESPWFADVPVLGFFFQEKGLSDEVTDLIIVIRAKITDFSHLRNQPVAAR
jgi:Flp pilus assembly secretin CpaC